MLFGFFSNVQIYASTFYMQMDFLHHKRSSWIPVSELYVKIDKS